ncbi:MAG: adenylate/guanylate cyclase domain-containing protein [Acidimicrobiales bacterium]
MQLGAGELPRLGRRVALRCTAGAVLANFAGGVFTFLYLTYIAPGEDVANANGPAANLLVFVAYFVVATLVTSKACAVLVRRSTSWVTEDRAPDDKERVRTLVLPRRLAFECFAPWLGAAALYAGLNVSMGHTASNITMVAIGTIDGGLVTCTIAFLLLERAMRPLVAVALDGADPPRRMVGGVRTRLLLTWALGSGVPLAALTFLPASAGPGDDIGRAVIVLSAAGLATGLLVTIATAKAVAEPLIAVRKALDLVREGRLDIKVAVDRGGDLGLLQAGVNDMVSGLRERHKLEELFGRHVGVEVAARAIEQDSGLDGEQREASALFVDIIGSTAMAEVLPPSEVLSTLNAYFGCVVRVVGDEGGWVNKFEGDGALCVFGAPATQPDHAARALRAARRLRTALTELRPEHPGLDAAIGVSSGIVVAGNVGTETRYEYTLIGAPVNEASRLTDMAKGRGSRVLASAGAVERAGDEAARWTALGAVALRGKSAPTAIFEPLEVREPAAL